MAWGTLTKDEIAAAKLLGLIEAVVLRIVEKGTGDVGAQTPDTIRNGAIEVVRAIKNIK